MDEQMELNRDDLTRWPERFQEFIAPFQELFVRSEPRSSFERHLWAMAATELPSKNGWTCSEHQGHLSPQPLQRLVRTAKFDDNAGEDLYIEQAIASMATDGTILVFDETGFIKSGSCSVGVQRQYTGTSGKIDNCQVAVFAAITSNKGHCFVDRRLYMPKSWMDSPHRCKKAGGPDELEFATKPQLALQMYKRCLENGLRPAWVSADSVYGDGLAFCDGLYLHRQPFVVEVSCNSLVFTKPPEQGAQPERVDEVAGRWTGRFKTLSVGMGSKGERRYQWGRRRVYLSRAGKPVMSAWLLVRRSLSKPDEVAYYLCWSPKDVGLKRLARVAASRWSIELCFKEAKGWAGLDEYQVRKWTPWHRWTLFSMLVHLWLALVRSLYHDPDPDKLGLSVPEVARLMGLCSPLPRLDRLFRWLWSLFRRRHNLKAARSHTRRRRIRYAHTK